MPFFRDSTSAAVSATSTTIAKPAGVVAGDLLIYVGAGQFAGGTVSGGAAWNSAASVTPGGGTFTVLSNYKIAGASEPASYSVAIAGATSRYVGIIVAIGAPHQTNPPVWATSASRTSTTISTPGITPNSALDVELRFAFTGCSSVVTFASPATYTETEDAQTATSTVLAGALAYKALSSASATSALDFTTSAANVDGCGLTFSVGPNSFPQTVTPSGVASSEAFGTGQFNFTIIGQGLASAEAFGTTGVFTPSPQTITGSGIASSEAFGTATTRLYIGASGIGTAEAFGLPRMVSVVGPSSIPSAEAWGTTNVAIEQFLSPGGIVSLEAWGTAALQLGYPQDIFPEGIESAELVEDPTIRNDERLMLVNPSIQETPAAWDSLNVRFGLHRGISIIRDQDGVWRSLRYPAQTELEVAQRVYLGGRRHVLTVDEANELIDAGYGEFITLEPDI